MKMGEKESTKMKSGLTHQEKMAVYHNRMPKNYVEISHRNSKLLFESEIGQNEPIFIFDMDGVVYNSPELFKDTTARSISKFIALTNRPEGDYWNLLKKYGHRRTIFTKELNVTGREICCDLESPDFSRMLKKDAALIHRFSTIPYRTFLFTNALKCKTQQVLDLVGLEDSFQRVFCIGMEDSSTFMKPNIDGFRFIERYLGITNPGQIHFFDDKAENIKGAKDAGWNGHLVANDTISQIDEAVSSSCSSCSSNYCSN